MFQGVQNLFKKPDPKELVRKWQAELRSEQRKIERQIRGGSSSAHCSCSFQWVGHSATLPPCYCCCCCCSIWCCCMPVDIQFEEKKVRKSIADAAKRSDITTCKVGSSSS